MSTDYRLLGKVPACDLCDGRLEEFGVREHVKPEATTEKSRLLTDGRNYLWVYIDDDGFVGCLTRYFPNGALTRKRNWTPARKGWRRRRRKSLTLSF